MQVNKVNDRLSVAPQIQPDQVAALKAAGFDTVICNRPDGEEPGQPAVVAIEAACKAEGVGFHHIPVSGGTFPEAAVRDFGDAVSHRGGRVLAFCRTGTRSITLASLANPFDLSSTERLKQAAAAGYDLTCLIDRL